MKTKFTTVNEGSERNGKCEPSIDEIWCSTTIVAYKSKILINNSFTRKKIKYNI